MVRRSAARRAPARSSATPPFFPRRRARRLRFAVVNAVVSRATSRAPPDGDPPKPETRTPQGPRRAAAICTKLARPSCIGLVAAELATADGFERHRLCKGYVSHGSHCGHREVVQRREGVRLSL